MGRWRLVLAGVSVGVLATLSTAAAAAPDPATPARWPVAAGQWTLQLPKDLQRLEFHGELNVDQGAAGGGAMMYPAPSLAGFLAAVLTHAALVESSKSAQRDKALAEADQTLQPLAPALEALSPTALSAAVAPLLGAAPQPAWQVEVAPVYVFSRDLRSLSVESHLLLRRAAADEVLARTAVRATAAPLAAERVPAGWTDNDGQALRQTAAQLLVQAVTAGLRSLAGDWDQATAPQRTVRYPFGGGERIERVQVLESRCEGAVVRHLRGDLMVIPWRDPSRAGECPPSDRP
ncbi:hypothetical protein KAK07_08155 [Ideonella sp. 4Y16]|uniref:hypothetical protein n=1 Tax=Ideonella alba TaxID=2824118 RepID=UPI001B36A90B|nr:hypothetical protein [Ideonella alba]MBQ0943308.1 hypothetical protein [Ideonella alba]